jgi:hypothetical protein
MRLDHCDRGGERGCAIAPAGYQERSRHGGGTDDRYGLA